MPRFMTAGKAGAVRGSVQRTILDQGGAAGYTEQQRPLVDQVAKSIEDVLAKLPGDGHVSLAGYITHTGNTLDALIEIHANDVNLALDTGYTEPKSVAGNKQIAGAGASQEGNVRDLSASSRDAQASVQQANTTQKFPASPFGAPSPDQIGTGKRTEVSEVQISRDPVTDPAVPRGANAP